MKLCSVCANCEPGDAVVCLNCGGIELAALEANDPTGLDQQVSGLRANLEALRTWFQEYGRDGLIMHGYTVREDAA